jgi:6-pyruvoyltetrahydropterin/6-carboxytetrahydropterin synthase
MIMTLYTEDFFDAAHLIEGYDGKCSRIHGHTWKIAVWIRGDSKLIDKNGILWDFSNIKKITHEFDHKNLNEVIDVNPTAENLAVYVYKKMKKDSPDLSFKVRIYEKIIKKESYCETGDF